MQRIFRFWGFSRCSYAACVGAGRPIGPASCPDGRASFGHVDLSGDLLDLCDPLQPLCAEGWGSWIVYDRSTRPRGEPLAWLRAADGHSRPLITRTTSNTYRFWFDLDRTLACIRNEGYAAHRTPLYVRLRVNPDRLPNWARNAGFRVMHGIRSLRGGSGPLFPRYPSDVAVDAWLCLIRNIVDASVEDSPVPLWPQGRKYAVIASHDIDTDYCLRHPDLRARVREADESAGLRAAWMIVTKLLPAARPALDELHAAGHEIGFHGTRHDHRLAFLPPRRMAERIAEARPLIEAYGTTGFRSPSYLRTPHLYRALNGVLQYDMSMHDAVEGICRSRRRNEGCSTCLPFFIDGTDLLEIPTTIPEDWYFDLLGITDPREVLRHQLESLQWIRARGGVAGILTHPEPELSVQPKWLDTYRELLARVADDTDAWLALPGEVNRHWRERRARIDALWSDAPDAADDDSRAGVRLPSSAHT